MEVKARSAFQPKAWIDQVTKRAAKTGGLPIVTCRLNGQGEGSPQDYLAFMRLGDLVDSFSDFVFLEVLIQLNFD